MLKGLLTLPVIVPVLFWAAYHYYKDRHLPEPVSHLLLCFAFGIGASWLAIQFYGLLGVVGLRYDATVLADSSTAALLAYALFGIGPVEELAKLLPFVLIVIRFKEFDEPIDGIIYASFIALGYAAAENVYYLQFLTPAEALARGFAGPLVHIVFASIWGHWIGMARLEGRSLIKAALAGWALAAAAHGLYDFIVLQRPYNALPIAAALILTLWLWRLKVLHLLHLDAVSAVEAESPDGDRNDREDQPRL